MRNGRKRAERQFLCSTPSELIHLVKNKSQDFGLHLNDLKPPCQIILTEEEHKHLSLALRLRVGDDVGLLDKVHKVKYHGIIKSITKDHTHIEVSSFSYFIKPETSAIIGITDQKVLDFLVEKLVELGIDHIIFFKADFSSAVSNTKQIKLDRLEKIRDSALKQSGAYSDTKITFAHDLLDALSNINSETLRIVLLPPNDKEWKSLNYLLGQSKGVSKIAFAIGPEGGLSDKEVLQLQEGDFIVAGLSNNTLRVETACIVTAGIILQHLNSLQYSRND